MDIRKDLKEININLEIIAKQLCELNKNKYIYERSWIEENERLQRGNKKGKQ